MADRMVRAVWAKPRRRIGFSVALAGLFAAAVLLTVMLSTGSPSAQTVGPNGPGPSLQAIAGKVNALIGKMTVAEKFGQLEMAGPDGAERHARAEAAGDAKAGQIGSVLDLVGVDNINQAQQAALQSRLHIPLIFSLDVIHGYKTMFPVPLGEAAQLGSRRGPARRVRVGRRGHRRRDQVDVQPDGRHQPRPALGPRGRGRRRGPVPRLGDRRREGPRLSGHDFSAPDKMAATIKHFAAYGAPVAGREYNTVDMSTQQLFNDYLPPYKAASTPARRR